MEAGSCAGGGSGTDEGVGQFYELLNDTGIDSGDTEAVPWDLSNWGPMVDHLDGFLSNSFAVGGETGIVWSEPGVFAVTAANMSEDGNPAVLNCTGATVGAPCAFRFVATPGPVGLFALLGHAQAANAIWLAPATQVVTVGESAGGVDFVVGDPVTFFFNGVEYPGPGTADVKYGTVQLRLVKIANLPD